MAVTRVEAKAKLSQNRSWEDQQGVVEGLGESADPGAAAVRAAMVRLHEGH
jgi:transcriptional regulator